MPLSAALSLLLLEKERRKREREKKDEKARRAAGRLDGMQLYCPHTPWPKQRAFLDLKCRHAHQTLEAFYGGAAGPGKSDALLMAALQYVHVPRFSALLLRRTMQRLEGGNSLMSRLRSWLYDSDAKWNGNQHTFTFPSSATIEFGYCDSPMDRFEYQGKEYQLIAWDELTEIPLPEDEHNPYEFLFSRLRRPRCRDHEAPDPECYKCQVAGNLAHVPLRMLSASNPGGLSHMYVKNRFIPEEALKDAAEGNGEAAPVYWIDKDKTRAFVPAVIKDNPVIDPVEYENALNHLPAVTRARLLRGDWSVVEDAILRRDTFRYFKMRGDLLIAHDGEGNPIGHSIERDEIERFATVDTAGTSKQKERESKGKPSSWSVMQIWEYYRPARWLFLRYCWRRRVGWHDLRQGVADIGRNWGPNPILIERAHCGPQLYEDLCPILPVELVNPVTKSMKGQSGMPGKLERSIPLQKMLDRGEIFLPMIDHVPGAADWLTDLESEWISWRGLPDETSDQVDCASYAAAHVDEPAAGDVEPDSDPDWWKTRRGPNVWGGRKHWR